MAKLYPLIGSWYQDAVEDILFEVVAVDDQSGTIDIQYVGGEVSEIDFDTWGQMVVLHAEQPEDWRSSYELNTEDRFEMDGVIVPEDFQGPLSSIEPDISLGLDEF